VALPRPVRWPATTSWISLLDGRDQRAWGRREGRPKSVDPDGWVRRRLRPSRNREAPIVAILRGRRVRLRRCSSDELTLHAGDEVPFFNRPRSSCGRPEPEQMDDCRAS